MTSLDLDALLVTADRAARAGGEIVRAHFGAPDGVREKAPGDWVTATDVASETAVRAVLEQDTGLPVFGEEAGGDRADIGWLVDPLDGTSNFVHGLEAVGVSVGLVAGGEPVVGVVHAPLLDRTYAARLGGGAFRDERRLHVSSRTPDQAIVATGFPFRRKDLLDRYEPAFGAAIHRFEDLRRVGGASLDLCWTAEGVFDGYFELKLGPWDVAAGGVIVREAGGVVTDWDGDDRGWLRSGNILAGPPQVHAALLERAAATAVPAAPAN
jgi:myo-inositol-1(or 4)-monophosphatase